MWGWYWGVGVHVHMCVHIGFRVGVRVVLGGVKINKEGLETVYLPLTLGTRYII